MCAHVIVPWVGQLSVWKIESTYLGVFSFWLDIAHTYLQISVTQTHGVMGLHAALFGIHFLITMYALTLHKGRSNRLLFKIMHHGLRLLGRKWIETKTQGKATFSVSHHRELRCVCVDIKSEFTNESMPLETLKHKSLHSLLFFFIIELSP